MPKLDYASLKAEADQLIPLIIAATRFLPGVGGVVSKWALIVQAMADNELIGGSFVNWWNENVAAS